jgi:outer membrane protein OmpA-like peptidoglycan-associated protein
VRAAIFVAISLVLGVASVPVARAQGVTLDAYRAAETPRDGFVVTRPRTLGHLGVSASLHLDYALEPLRGPASATGGVLVDHELVGQVGGAIGFLDRFVFALRLPVVLVMGGPAGATGAPLTRDPSASGAGLGDLALTFRSQLVGGEGDVFALAFQTEATIPLAEAASASQDLAGESGVSFTPELAAELRFAPVHITANLGARFRETAGYQTLRVRHELTWALAVGVDVVEDVFDITLEGFGTTPFDRFATSSLSPVELLLGARVRPISPLYVGLAGGLGLGDGYGAPAFRGVLTLGWAEVGAVTSSEPESASEDGLDSESELESQSEGEIEGDVEGEAETAEVAPPPPSADRVPPPDPGDYGQLDRDGDRIVDAEDHCVLDREDYDEIEDRDGCPEEDADADAVADVIDACPMTPGIATDDDATRGCPERAYITERGAIVISDRVEFATGSDRILPASEPVLTDVLAILESSEDVARVRIEGHTDDRGRDLANIRLSRARAASVVRWLVAHGVPAERLEAWGCGELHPLAAGSTRADRQTNRRVEFFVVEPMSPDLTLREGCEEAPR